MGGSGERSHGALAVGSAGVVKLGGRSVQRRDTDEGEG